MSSWKHHLMVLIGYPLIFAGGTLAVLWIALQLYRILYVDQL